jgi:hypothetical protein
MVKNHDPIINLGCLGVLGSPGRIQGRFPTGGEEARFMYSRKLGSVSAM